MMGRRQCASHADCGALMRRVGRVIEDQAKLPVADANTLRNTFAIDSRTNCELLQIDAAAKTVEFRQFPRLVSHRLWR